MATKKQRKVIPLEPGMDLIPHDPDEDTIQSIVESLGGSEVAVKVYKIDGVTQFYCGTIDAEDARARGEEAVIALGYGSGKYLLKFFVGQMFNRNHPIAIADKPAGLVAQAGGETPMMRMLIQAIERMDQRFALMQNNRPEREPINDLADALAKMHSMANAGQSQNALTPEAIMGWVQLGKTLAGGGEEVTLAGVIRDVVKESAPTLLQLLASRGGAVPPPQQAQIGAPSVDAQTIMFKQGVAFLKKKCLKGTAAGLYIELVLDNADDPLYQPLIHAILTQDFSAFETIDPELATEPFKSWFTEIHDGIRLAYKPDDPVEPDPGGKPGNKGNAGNNGKGGKGGVK